MAVDLPRIALPHNLSKLTQGQISGIIDGLTLAIITLTAIRDVEAVPHECKELIDQTILEIATKIAE